MAKIKTAIVKYTGNEILARAYDKVIHGDVICPDVRCGCDLEGVRATCRNIQLKGERGRKQVDVEAFFRLHKNAEKAGRGHALRCRYNIEETIKQIVRRSQEITKFERDAEPLLCGVRGDRPEFRLHILMEIIKAIQQVDGISEGDEGSINRRLRGNAYVRSNKYLKPYFRTAKSILSLIARCQTRSELSRLIRLRYGPHDIRWEEYFFDVHEHGALYEYLLRHEQFTREPGKGRPVSAVIKISGAPPRKNDYGSWEVKGAHRVYHREMLGKFAVWPTIYTNNFKLAETLAKEEYVLVCAVPTISPLKQPKNAALKPSASIRFNIINKLQCCKYPKILLP